MSDQFRTFQTVRNYESALGRHAQSVLWTRAILCPCLNSDTFQPDIDCDLCRGRGRIYKFPGPQRIFNEMARHNRAGRIFPRYEPVVEDSVVVRKPSRDDTGGTVDVPFQLSDGVLEITGDDIPPEYDFIFLDYSFSPTRTVVNGMGSVENAAMGIIHVDVPVKVLNGKRIYGRLITVSSVRIDSDDPGFSERSLTVASTISDIFEADSLLEYDNVKLETPSQLTDAIAEATNLGAEYRIEVDYTYTEPFRFLISNISEKQRYTSPYITKEADAMLTVPSWARISPNDLFTVLGR